MSEKLFSEAMGEISDKYITEAINYKGKKNTKRIWLRKIGKYVVAACLAFIIGFGILMAVSTEARAAVWGWVREFAGGVHYKYFFEGDEIETSEEVEALKYYPGWLPEDTEYVTTIEEIGGEIHIYTNENDALIRFSYSTDPKGVTYIDGAEYTQKSVMVNGCTGTIYLAPSKEQTNSIIWTDDSIPVIFFFAADCSEEDLLKVAENVKLIKEEEQE